MDTPIRRLPDGELDVMQAVWACEPPAALADIDEMVQQTHPMGQTTLLTVLGRLSEKGFLQIQKQRRKSRYVPLISRGEYLARQSRDFVEKICGGLPAFASALCDSGLTKEELAQLRDLLDRNAL